MNRPPLAAPALAALVLAAPPLPGAIVLDAPGHAAAEGSSVAARGGVPGAAFSIEDWRGRDTGLSGTWDDAGEAVLPALPCGYWRLRSGDDATTLAVVPDPGERPFPPADSPFAIDTALSWVARPGRFLCPWNGGDTFRTVADLVRLAGFAHVRERLSWREVQPGPDAPPDFARYLANADLFRERGAAVSGMFHDAPAWTSPAFPRESLPADLGALHRFCHDAATAFGNRMEDWEFWNEEDIHFVHEPVWEYAAAMKAAYLGFKAARPDMPVLCGALCQDPLRSSYQRAFFRSGVADYFDIFNYHTYLRIARYPGALGRIRADMAAAGIAGKPVWITEFGTNAEGHSSEEGAMKGMKAHSPAQETVHAEIYPKSQIALLMEGVARAYFFVFPAFNERFGYKDWGVMRRDGTVKPVFAAMATAIRQLDGARLLGAIDAPDGIRAYLFERPDGAQTVAFWSESPADTLADSTVVVPEPDFAREWRPGWPGDAAAAPRLVDLCGMARDVPRTGDGALVLPVTRFPAYLSGMRGLAAATPPHSAASGAAAPAPDGDGPDRSIVLRPILSRDDFGISGGKTLAVLNGDEGRFRLQVWNFSDTAKTGTVSAAGASVAGLPEDPFPLAPGACATFDCTLAPGAEDAGDLVLGASFDGRPATPSIVPVFFAKRFLASCERLPIALDDPSRWERNTSAEQFSASFDEAEGALRFDASWSISGTDRWFYPVRTLDLPAESLAGATRIAFEVKSAQDKVENDFRTSKLMLVDDDAGTDLYLDYEAPTDSWEQRFVDLPPDADLSGITSIRLGANPSGHRCTLWVRNLEILK